MVKKLSFTLYLALITTVSWAQSFEEAAPVDGGTIVLDVSEVTTTEMDDGSTVVVFPAGTAHQFTVPNGITSIDFLLVGGGGAGGHGGNGPVDVVGGGGAGGRVDHGIIYPLAGETVTVYAGLGGNAGSTSVAPTSGEDSYLTYNSTTVTANGGGYGASETYHSGADAVNGGGASASNNNANGSWAYYTGENSLRGGENSRNWQYHEWDCNFFGNNCTTDDDYYRRLAAGGGAGDSDRGDDGSWGSKAGNGGSGTSSILTGESISFGGGGGGGYYSRNSYSGYRGGIGQDGGGDGKSRYESAPNSTGQGGFSTYTTSKGHDGEDGRGGGGGGGTIYLAGGNGGNGVVVLRYAVTNNNFYVENGTCKCPDAEVGETGYIYIENFAFTYTKRNREQIEALIEAEDWDALQRTCTSGITSMYDLFNGVTNFNTYINHWDVSNVTSMSRMFQDATSFNQPLNNWDVSNVIYIDDMFKNASSFNQPLNHWDVSNVGGLYGMQGMFEGASSFNQNIDVWDVSNVTHMSYMFKDATAYNTSMNNWDMSNVIRITGMFQGATSYNQPVDNWDVSSVQFMESVFSGATSFNQSLNQWDVSSVYYFPNMFNGASAFNKPLDAWDVSNAITMTSMFENATSFNQDLRAWCVDSINNEPTNFANNSGLSSDYEPTWGSCGTSTNPDFYIENGTCKCPNAAVGDNGLISVPGVTGTFTKRDRAGLDALIAAGNWDEVQKTCTTGITDMSQLFKSTSTPFTKNISHWDVSSVVNMEEMFYGNDSFSFNPSLNNWDVSNVTNMRRMFYFCTYFNEPLNDWDVSSVTNMSEMFYYTQVYNQPLNNWDVSNVTNMSGMFRYNFTFDQDLSTWDVSSVTNMSYMFDNAYSFNQPLSNWDISNVTDMTNMFNSASNFNQDLSGWCVSHIESAPTNFTNSDFLEANLPNWGASCDISIDLDSETLDLAVSRISSGNNVTLTGTNPTINQAMSGTGDLVINTTSLTMSESVNVGNLSITTTNGTTFSGSNKTLQASGTMTLNTDVDVTGSITLSATQATLAKGKHIEVTGSLTNNATVLEMDSDSNEFATLRVNGGSMSGTGDMAYNRYVNSFPNNDLVSAPFAGMTFSAMISDSGNDALMANPDNSAMYLFGTYDTATDSWTNFTTTANANQALVAGKGYRAGGNNTAGDDFATFKTPDGYNYSVLTTGVDIALDNAGNGWNLVGNPYPTYLSLADVLSANSDVMHQGESWGVYAYNGDYGDGNDADDWLVFNSSNADGVKIAPGQGFFVRTSASNQSFSFAPDMQTNTGGDDFIAGRSTNSESQHIKLRLGNGEQQAHTDIYLNTNGSNGLDVGYDSSLFQNAPAEFALYSHLVADNQGLPMAIQTLSTDVLTNPSTTAIPLGVESVAGTQLTFGIDTSNLPVGTQVFLEDAQNNSFTDLTQQDYIVGISDALSGTGRFYIHLGQNSTLSSNDNAYQYLQVYAPKGSGTIVVSGLVESGMALELYDLLGRNVMTQELEASNGRQTFAVGHLADGTYVVNLQGNKGSRAVKVVLSK